MVKLRPHRQTSTTDAPYTKLAKRFNGPFQILEQIGKVAYKLQLPEGSHIHHVFHCSILKAFHQLPIEASYPVVLLPIKVGNQPTITPHI